MIIHQQYNLEDNVVSSAFPSIHYLLKLFVSVPMSEAVIERGFSKIKLTLTDMQTQLNNKSLDALMRMSFKKWNIGSRSSATNSRDTEETAPKKNII